DDPQGEIAGREPGQRLGRGPAEGSVAQASDDHGNIIGVRHVGFLPKRVAGREGEDRPAWGGGIYRASTRTSSLSSRAVTSIRSSAVMAAPSRAFTSTSPMRTLPVAGTR